MKKLLFFGVFFLFGHTLLNAQILSLSGRDWEIKDIPNDSTIAFCNDWIPALVPGNIQADLETARILKPLSYGTGDKRLYDVAKNRWCYRKDFKVPDEFSGKRIRLIFEGVDYACELWLNGKKIGSNPNMFRRFEFDITDMIKIGKTNRLEVQLSSIPPIPALYIEKSDGKESGYPTKWWFVNGMVKTIETLKDLKSPTNFAYDWGVNIWTLGIWKDVYLEGSDKAVIEYLKIETPLSDNYTKAKIQVDVMVNSLAAGKGILKFKITGNGKDTISEMPFSVKEGSNLLSGEIELENPALWWPNGHGEQNLYNLEATLMDVSGKVSHSCNSSFGVREVRWQHTAGAPADFPQKYMPVINGRKIRMIGSNLIPPDLLFARIPQSAPNLLRQARASGFTTLRLWGGGVIFTPEFYDLADELGIMLSLEIPIANSDPKPDPDLLNNLDTTLRNIIHQVWNHPSIIEYTGGNEMSYGKGGDFTVLNHIRNIFAEEDPERIFRDTDPVSGGTHGPWDAYLDLTNEEDPLTVYHSWNQVKPFVADESGSVPERLPANSNIRMRSGEFGYQTTAHLEVWERDIPPSDQWPIEKENPVLIRKNVSYAVFSSDNWLQKSVIDFLFGESPDLEFLLKAGQYIGAEGLRYAMDAIRRGGEATGGLMTWDFNEPWTNGAGSYQFDYDGRPLMNNTFVRQAASQLSLSLRHSSSLYNVAEGIKTTMYLTSDMDEKANDLIWSWKARDRRGTVISSGKGKVNINPLEVKKLAEISVHLREKTCFGPFLFELKLSDAKGEIVNERVHIFGLKGVRSSLRGLLDHHILEQDDDKKMLEELLKQVSQDAGGAVEMPEISRPVKQTTLEVTSFARHVENDQEVLEMELTNTGKMTALFCEPKPLLSYRTDLIWDNLYICISPGETRKIKVRAPLSHENGVNLSQIGWQIESWNTEPVRIEPSPDVLLSFGRKDRMCREFAGYPGLAPIIKDSLISLTGRLPGPAEIPYLMDHGKTLELEFEATSSFLGREALLRINSSDQSRLGAVIKIEINGTSFDAEMPEGYGFQKADPAHLGQEKTVEITLPEGVIKQGRNFLKIKVIGPGWFTWDSFVLHENL